MNLLGTMLSVHTVLLLALLGCISAEDPIVATKSGKLVGKAVEFSHKDVDVKSTVHVFKGIPFAEPPVGDLRFRPPQAKEPWEGVRDAANIGFACKQPLYPMLPLEEAQSEDCLYLNVYAPQTTAGPLPVMVWIHGGGFGIGSANQDGYYDATALAAIGDVIVVSINYRLGVFGFFFTGDEHAPGNYGLFDQIAALKWVQENIAAFGGDAGKVTIFGESAGSMSVDMLILSPLTDGLFHRAIMQSGSSFLDVIIRGKLSEHNKLAHALGEMVGCKKDTTEELVQCLRTVPSEDFDKPTDPANMMFANVSGVDPELATMPYSVSVDGSYVTAKTMDLLKQGAFPKTTIDIMIGSNADEGTLFLPMIFPDKVNDTEITMNRTVFDQMFAAFLFDGSFKNNPAVQDAIKLLYINWEEADSEDADYITAYSQMQGDFMFVCPNDLSARSYVQAGANVYMYHLTHIPASSLWRIKWMKAAHGEDLQYVFGGHFGPNNWTMPPEEVTMSLKIMKYWTNFAKTGNPNSSGDEEDPSLQHWPLFKIPGLEYKELSPKMENMRALKAPECVFWNDFIPKLVKYTDIDTVCTAPDDEAKKYTEESNQPQD